ncbi:hypothetical protein FB45DRAFT_1052032 [Roridomyces roridus]|uniref:DUF218 domain-containing protein n=1 Tax=Roridomyces roridus TaxID=1738132 RepID=A0AAD7CFZ2_9AGAR|nr:hypothetical protein FB45DRAFT_1052032 [Roridomyces roridus]
MLPRPVSTKRRHGSPYNFKFLLSRSRATNLLVCILLGALFVSFVTNVHLYFSSNADEGLARFKALASLLKPRKDLRNLIVVPGHAIWTGTDPDLRKNQDQWAFQSFQANQNAGRLELFFQHISAGARYALADPHSLLVFSGGQTQRESSTTEGESYLRLALKANLLQSDIFSRATSEDFALDSFQNLIFSIARFHEFTGHYPERILVVGYQMKRARFMDLHRAAIHWPENRFDYIGMDLPGDNSQAQKGEEQNGYLPYVDDLYGCHGFLADKRKQRNYALRYPSYYLSSPELRPLLTWCPQVHTELFKGTLPWLEA